MLHKQLFALSIILLTLVTYVKVSTKEQVENTSGSACDPFDILSKRNNDSGNDQAEA